MDGQVIGSVMVVGGGIAGMQAALDLGLYTATVKNVERTGYTWDGIETLENYTK